MAKKWVTLNEKEFEIAYIFINNDAQKNLVFLHGWGSNKELMKIAFQNVFKDFNHFYIDMPGFGDSPNNYVIATTDYARVVNEFIRSIGIQTSSVTMVGHSFGGKVALLCECNEIILLNSAGIPTPKSLKTKLKILLAKICKRLKIKSKCLRSADVMRLSETMYKVFKLVVDEDFSDNFARCTKKTIIFWSEKDAATPLKSGQKIASLIKNNRFFILTGDHYAFLSFGKIIDEKYHSLSGEKNK